VFLLCAGLFVGASPLMRPHIHFETQPQLRIFDSIIELLLILILFVEVPQDSQMFIISEVSRLELPFLGSDDVSNADLSQFIQVNN